MVKVMKQLDRSARLAAAGHGLLALLKGGAGLASGSSVLLVDACRSASEAAAAAGTPVSAYRKAMSPGAHKVSAEQLKDTRKHAFTIVVAVILLAVGAQFGVRAAMEITSEELQPPGGLALVVAALSGVIRMLLPTARGERKLEAAVWGLLLVGVGGAYVGGRIGEPVLYYLDPAGAAFMGVVLALQCYRLVIRKVSPRSRAELAKTDEALISDTVQKVDGVISIEHLEAREHGHYIVLAVTIGVNPRITMLDGQDIGRRVADVLQRRFEHIAEVNIQVEPYDAGYPYKTNHDPDQEHMPTLLQ